MNKKIILSLLLMIFSLVLGMNSIKADCSDCGIDNCSDCGCVVNANKTACVYSNYDKSTVSCGDGDNMITGIPKLLPQVVSITYTLIQVIIPILLVIFGSLDLVKGITAGKEDEIKKGQKILIKRVIVAAIIFFLIVIVKFLVSIVADATSSNNITDCIDCFLSGKCIDE